MSPIGDPSSTTPIIITPTKADDITPAWLEAVLGTRLNQETFHMTPNTHKGLGFLSNMLRVTCETKSGGHNHHQVNGHANGDGEGHGHGGETIHPKTLHIIIKLLPAKGSSERDLVLSQKWDQTEISFYQILVPDLISLLPSLGSNFCSVLYGRVQEMDQDHPEYTSVLVMEDLKASGYHTLDFSRELTLTLDQIQNGVIFIGGIHWAGRVLEARGCGVPLLTLYPFLQDGTQGGASVYHELLKCGLPFVDALLDSSETLDPEVKSAFKVLVPLSTQIFDLILQLGAPYAGLSHGDYWSNNSLFHHEAGAPIKIIDWQLACYQEPTFDLGLFLLTSLPLDWMRKGILETLVKFYWRTIRELNSSGPGSEVDLKFQDFTEFYRVFSTVGLAHVYIWMIWSAEVLATSPASRARFLRVFQILHLDYGVPEFILKSLKSFDPDPLSSCNGGSNGSDSGHGHGHAEQP